MFLVKGSRFALMQVKLIIYHLVAHFIFDVSEKTVIPMRFKKGMKLEPEGSVVDLKKRNKILIQLTVSKNKNITSYSKKYKHRQIVLYPAS